MIKFQVEIEDYAEIYNIFLVMYVLQPFSMLENYKIHRRRVLFHKNFCIKVILVMSNNEVSCLFDMFQVDSVQDR